MNEVKEKMAEPKICDVTCGSKTIWFNKNHPNAIYCDKRRESYEGLWKNSESKVVIDPDVQCDFTNLPFKDKTFALVLFDPPHLTGAKETSWLVKKYGKLDENWRQMLHDGFKECMRILKPDGVLIFKWSEHDIPANEVWKAVGEKPLFGHHSGKKSGTFWGCFMKIEGGAVMLDEMNRIQICKYCGKPEYYGKFVWLNGKMLCRDCYKKEYHKTYGEPYEWNDLDGHRPTFREYAEQEQQMEVQ